MRSTRFALVLSVFTATLAGAAHAAPVTGFSLDPFNPSERGSEWFAEDSLDLRGSLRPAIGVLGELAIHPLVLYNADGTPRAFPVKDQLILHPGASLVFLDRVRVGFDLPIAVFQEGQSGTVTGVTFPGAASAGVGDLRLGADVRIVGTYGGAFTLAAGGQIFLPTGSQGAYLGDGSVRALIPRLAIAGDIGPFAYAAHVGFAYRAVDKQLSTANALGSTFAFGASAGVRLADGNLLIGPELHGSTVVVSGDSAFATATTPVEVLLGLHYLIASTVRIGAGAGPGLTRAYGEPQVRALLSLEYAPAYKSAPPPPPPDRDHDGVLDADDACPDTPGVPTDDPKTNGCPPPPPDRDHDGIPDAEDACPDVPGVETSDPKTNGCPPDRDHDGILDADDACPDVPGIKTSDPKTNGCPPDPDRDKDGIPNDLDACPDAAGPPNPDPKKNGCPAAAVVGAQIVIVEQVKFATGSAKILPASDVILNAVLGVLTSHPEIKHLRIEGHTDNVGAAAMNKTLSRDRAASVVAWLVKHGIEPSRLTSEGFGMERPIDTNATGLGRQNNRRVEFHIEDGNGG